jgi:hypothetical protein
MQTTPPATPLKIFNHLGTTFKVHKKSIFQRRSLIAERFEPPTTTTTTTTTTSLHLFISLSLSRDLWRALVHNRIGGLFTQLGKRL